MRNPFTLKESTSREKQLIAIIQGIIEQSKPLSPIEMFNVVSPPPTWSENEIRDALSTMVENRKVELTNNGKLRMIYDR